LDLNSSAPYHLFEQEVVAFLAQHWPPPKTASREERAAATLRVRAEATERGYSSYHQLTKTAAGEPLGVLQDLNKLSSTEIGKAVAGVAQDIPGDAGLRMPSEEGGAAADHPEQWLNQIFGSLAMSIAGGASNIQRNIIAERGLGLPRGQEV
jgi:hypothetical protein